MIFLLIFVFLVPRYLNFQMILIINYNINIETQLNFKQLNFKQKAIANAFEEF